MAVLLSIGGFKFEVLTTAYDRLSKSYSFRWSEKNRIGNTSAMHFTGINNPVISLGGKAYTSFTNRDAYDRLIESARIGEPLTMVDGLGNVLGDWVIESVKLDESRFHKDGTPRKIEFSVSLKAYQ